MYGLNSDSLSGFGTITIVNAVTWTVSIPPTILPLPKGSYLWDFETVDQTGIIRTLYKGTFTINQDISNG
jgi:hypothetical protein